MFARSNLPCLSYKNLSKCQIRGLLYTMHSLSLPLLLVGSVLLAPMLVASGKPQDGLYQEHDPNFSRRHQHRQQNRNGLLSLQRRSVVSNTGTTSNEISMSSQGNEVHSRNIGSGEATIPPVSSSGRPKVCSSCMDRELYRNLTLMEIKKDILKKLNMPYGPPQVSRKDVDQHMMGQIVDRYRTTHGHIDHYGGIQNDGGRRSSFENDNEFQAKQITILAQKRK